MSTDTPLSTDLDLGSGFAWFARQRASPTWVINVAGYGAFLFAGSEKEAEEMRAHKANWEHGIAHKRPASFTDLPRPSACWNHRGYARAYWRGSRGRLLKKPWVPQFECHCGGCSRDH
jgi:hypothetical protein